MNDEAPNHVLDEPVHHATGRKVGLCGDEIGMAWHFLGAGHAFNSVRAGATAMPCPACWRVIRDVVTSPV